MQLIHATANFTPVFCSPRESAADDSRAVFHSVQVLDNDQGESYILSRQHATLPTFRLYWQAARQFARRFLSGRSRGTLEGCGRCRRVRGEEEACQYAGEDYARGTTDDGRPESPKSGPNDFRLSCSSEMLTLCTTFHSNRELRPSESATPSRTRTSWRLLLAASWRVVLPPAVC